MQSNNVDSGSYRPIRVLPDQPSQVMRAIDSEGVPYQGNLIRDVRDYNRLLSRSLRGLMDEGEMLKRLEALESRLLRPPASARESELCNRDRRFYCSVPTRVHSSILGSVPVLLIDFGADGAQLFSHKHKLPIRSMVWLTLDMTHEGVKQTLVFGSRVSWYSNNSAGLIFTGEILQFDSARSPAPLSRAEDGGVHRLRPMPMYEMY